jgi:hypothetical protein
MADSDRHKNPYVAGIRGASRQLRDDAAAAAEAAGYPDLSAWTVTSWRWLARYPGADEPRRPSEPADVARHLLAQFATAVDELGSTDPAAAGQLLAEAAALVGVQDQSGTRHSGSAVAIPAATEARN